MSHTKNKVDWCLNKAKKELSEGAYHRGLIIVEPNIQKAKEYINKAEHYLLATDCLKKGNFSDISASTVFYSMYHCLLAIAVKFGYESRNQECTFALVHFLIEEKKINFNIELLNKISSINLEDREQAIVGIREQYQYGTGLSLKESIYIELFEMAKQIILKTKEIIEE